MSNEMRFLCKGCDHYLVCKHANKEMEECSLYKPYTVDAKPVVHGRWIIRAEERRPFEFVTVSECPICHEQSESKRSIYVSGFSMDMIDEIVRKEAKDMVLANYCPNCGAKMDGDGNG